MDDYEAYATLWAMLVILQTPLFYSLSPVFLLLLLNSDFCPYLMGGVPVKGIPSRTVCLWESGGGRGMAEAPGPTPSCLFVCRRGADFPPSVSVCACLPFVSGGRLSGSACILPGCPSLYFPVLLREVVGSQAPWCVKITVLT